jgi:anion-transporting  ArsA/GET3 family ATPase
MSILDRRVALVTGKGGVGKTTVSTLIALRAARAGKRTLLCETSGSTQVPGLFGQKARGYEVTELAPNLHTMSITSDAAIEDYIVMQLKFRRLYKLVFRNRIVGPFVDAVPGLHDLIQLGKVFDLERNRRSNGSYEWDFIVIDAPATGHGLTMLASPRAMMDLTVSGPFHDNARDVASLYEDPARTALILVSLPEELPVHETEELFGSLGSQRSLVRGIVLNEVHPSPVPDIAAYRALRPALAAGADGAAQEILRFADAGVGRAERQEEARRRLSTLGPPVFGIPFLCDRAIGTRQLSELVGALEDL